MKRKCAVRTTVWMKWIFQRWAIRAEEVQVSDSTPMIVHAALIWIFDCSQTPIPHECIAMFTWCAIAVAVAVSFYKYTLLIYFSWFLSIFFICEQRRAVDGCNECHVCLFLLMQFKPHKNKMVNLFFRSFAEWMLAAIGSSCTLRHITCWSL